MAIELDDGTVIHLGLNLPTEFPTFFNAYRSERPIYTEAEARAILDSGPRMTTQDFASNEDFIDRQVNNACCGFAGAGALGRQRVLQGMEKVILSGDDMYAQINGGRDQGAPLITCMQKIVSGGIAPRSMVKVGTFLERQIPAAAKAQRPNFRAASCWAIDTELEMVTALIKKMQMVVAVEVDGGRNPNYMRVDEHGVVLPTSGVGNHAICASDLRWRAGRWEFWCPGSWGRRLHVNGAGWHTWKGHFQKTVRHHRFFAIEAASSNPNQPLPQVA